jgi:DNA-directed RNA polymerase subunit RPC12/RpoP
MKQLDRVMKMKDIKKGKYYVERHITSGNNEPVTKKNEKVRAFIIGQCECGSQLVGDIDLLQEAKELPCNNKECNYKFLYKDNTLYSL